MFYRVGISVNERINRAVRNMASHRENLPDYKPRKVVQHHCYVMHQQESTQKTSKYSSTQGVTRNHKRNGRLKC